MADTTNTKRAMKAQLYVDAYKLCTVPEQRHWAKCKALDDEIEKQLRAKDFKLPVDPPIFQNITPIVVHIRETWIKQCGVTYTKRLIKVLKQRALITPAAPAPAPIPDDRKFPVNNHYLACLPQGMNPTMPMGSVPWATKFRFFQRYRTLADIFTQTKHNLVKKIQNQMEEASVARCMEALWRTDDILENAIDWLHSTKNDKGLRSRWENFEEGIGERSNPIDLDKPEEGEVDESHDAAPEAVEEQKTGLTKATTRARTRIRHPDTRRKMLAEKKAYIKKAKRSAEELKEKIDELLRNDEVTETKRKKYRFYEDLDAPEERGRRYNRLDYGSEGATRSSPTYSPYSGRL